jgi:glycosyltransferase involved in cell wall biosynthesis
MIEKIDVLMPESSQYQVLHHFSQKLFEALCRTGLSCRLLKGLEIEATLLSDPPDLTVCFNGAPQDAEGIFLCDIIQKPHLSYLVDVPYHYYELLQSPHMAIACVDEFYGELLDSLRFPNHLFLPHAVEREIFEDTEREKSFEVVMLASFIDYKIRMQDWKKKFPTYVVKAMQFAVEQTFADASTSFIEAFHAELNQQIKQITHFDLRAIPYFTIFREIELCIKGKGRIDLVKALKDLPVHLFCSEEDQSYWKKALGKKTRTVFHPPIDYASSYDLMKASRIVLNSSPHIKRGAQERIFGGLACDALVVTAENAYLNKIFRNNEDLLLYQPTKLDQLPEQVSYYLENEEQRRTVAQSGKLKVKQAHTWDHRVKTLMDQIN